MKVLNYVLIKLLHLKCYLIFKKKVGVFGNFTVVHPENVSIGNDCGINHGVFILGASKIKIGSRVVLSARCMLIDAGLNSTEFGIKPFPDHTYGPIIIEDGVWIGAGAIILPGVCIGRNSIIGAGSVVTANIPDGSLAVGNPARVVKKLYE